MCQCRELSKLADSICQGCQSRQPAPPRPPPPPPASSIPTGVVPVSIRAFILAAGLVAVPCSCTKSMPAKVATPRPQRVLSSAGTATVDAPVPLGDRYTLQGQGCRRTLYRGDRKVCDAVVVPRGPKPCEEEVSLVLGPDGGPQIETMFGSGCGSENAVLGGPMGKELFFVETEDQGFIVLCDGARVDHIDEFALARQRCRVVDRSIDGAR